MRYAIAVLLVLSLLSFGCLQESDFPTSKGEQVVNIQQMDLDGDGISDYWVYEFAPVTLSDGSMRVQRTMTASAVSLGNYWMLNESLTDVDLLLADESLADFSDSRLQADSACSQAIGISNVVCSDIATCSKLCSSASLKCKRLAASYDDVLADSMIDYVKSNNDIRTTLIDARRRVLTLREESGEKDAFLQDIKDIIASIAKINANPLYSYQDFGLCSPSDYGIDYLLEAANAIGSYETQTVSYNYNMMVSAKPIGGGEDISKITLTDRLPGSAVGNGEQIMSIQELVVSEEGSDVSIGWDSTRSSEEGYLLHYRLSSTDSPETMASALRTPSVKLSRINLAILAPFDLVLGIMMGITGNYYVSLGVAAGVVLAFLFFVYTIVILLFTVISERAGGAPLTKGFRKAFGRTDVRWKTDIVIAVILLALGYYVSAGMVSAPASAPGLLQMLEFLAKSGWGVVGTCFMLLGVLMVYFAAENITKITILERAYGMVIKQERDLFLARVASLKDMLQELETLVESCSKENFDVSKEYDILALVKADKVDLLAKEMNARSKVRIEEYLSRVESSLAGLKQRKKLADENWPKWKEGITKTLNEQGEVYVSTLVTIPASLRAWALERYMSEEGAGALSLDRDVLKKKKVSADKLLGEMVGGGLMKGAVVMKQGKVAMSEFQEGSGTVQTALSLKLMNYLKTMARNLGQHEPQSFVAVGGKTVIVMMKNRNLQSVLFVNKPKFKEAIELWKSKSRALDS